MKKFARFLFGLLKVLVGIVLVAAAALYFGSVRLPTRWVNGLCDRFSSARTVLNCGSASLSLRDGVTVRDVRVFDPTCKTPLVPVFSAHAVTVDPMRRRVTVVAAGYPRLFDSYYAPGYTEPFDAKAPCGVFAFPALGDFELVLERPGILGIAAERVSADVSCTPRRLLFSRIRLVWPDQDRPMWLDGFCDVNLSAGTICGEVKGLATQAHIRPLLVALDLPSSYPYIDAFTEVPGPVGAYCGWNVNLGKNEFGLKLDLHPPMGRYNGVAMARTDGTLDLLVQYGGRLDYHHRIGPISAVSPKGGTLDGTVRIDGTNQVVHLVFDARSTLPLDDLFAIADVYRNGEADFLSFDDPPSGTIRGVLAPNLAQQADNDVRGRLASARMALFGVPLTDASCAWSYVGDRLSFEDIRATGRMGGKVTGGFWGTFPGGAREKGRFGLDLKYGDGSVGELADIFKADLGERRGTVSGELALTGSLASNSVDRLNGHGRVSVRDGYLSQLKLFAGLTDFVSKKVPGFSAIVNQSQASADFTVSNGVLRSSNVLIEGSVFALAAGGSYDMAADNLDFRVRLQFLKDENFLSKLVHPVVWPFSKLFMEFELTGSLDAPNWKYVMVTDRIPWPSLDFGRLLPKLGGDE